MNQGNIVSAIHHLKIADEHFADFLRERPSSSTKIIFNKYRLKIQWILNDIVTIRAFNEPVRQALRNEIKSDVLALTSINDKIALLPDEQRQQIEIMLDELLVIHKANKVNSVIEM